MKAKDREMRMAHMMKKLDAQKRDRLMRIGVDPRIPRNEEPRISYQKPPLNPALMSKRPSSNAL